jgi:cobyrinic acid a,c-diamide synthase
MNAPRIIMAALRGGAGKTVLSMGTLAAWKARGVKVVPFKKGPDYIDAGWLAKTAGHPCYNLDPFLMGKRALTASFKRRSQEGDLCLIEGNRGVFDGIDARGTYSTAQLAKWLEAPVILIVDCTKATRTVAAMVLGCLAFDPDLPLRGLILNHIVRSRHEAVIRKTIEQTCDLPILGVIPRMTAAQLPERHLGLVPFQEHPGVEQAIELTRNLAEQHLDLDLLYALARQAPPLGAVAAKGADGRKGRTSARARIGVIQDEAFQFYYPENLEALDSAGAELVFLNALSGSFPGGLDGVYVGGGFPETQALGLAQNEAFRRSLRAAAEEGLPIYAECGGLMYLGQTLVYRGNSFPMAGVLPLTFGLERKPQGHGYTMIRVARENPYFPVGTVLKGHEFHYSRVIAGDLEPFRMAFELTKGEGLQGRRDGVVYKNILATYTHLHALGSPLWAKALVARAEEYRLERKHEKDRWLPGTPGKAAEWTETWSS